MSGEQNSEGKRFEARPVQLRPRKTGDPAWASSKISSRRFWASFNVIVFTGKTLILVLGPFQEQGRVNALAQRDFLYNHTLLRTESRRARLLERGQKGVKKGVRDD
jgi:hypothetical protein